MKKKLLAVFTAVTVLMMSSVPVLAADSPSTTSTPAPTPTGTSGQYAVIKVEGQKSAADYAASTTVSAGFEVSAASDATVSSAIAAVQDTILYDVASVGKTLGNDYLTMCAADPAKRVTATVQTVVEIDKTSATTNAEGKYEVTVGCPSVKAGDTILVMHGTGSGYEQIKPSSVADGKVSFATASFSPFAIVKMSVTAADVAPQTGVAFPVGIVLTSFVALLGAAFCGKKFFA